MTTSTPLSTPSSTPSPLSFHTVRTERTPVQMLVQTSMAVGWTIHRTKGDAATCDPAQKWTDLFVQVCNPDYVCMSAVWPSAPDRVFATIPSVVSRLELKRTGVSAKKTIFESDHVEGLGLSVKAASIVVEATGNRFVQCTLDMVWLVPCSDAILTFANQTFNNTKDVQLLCADNIAVAAHRELLTHQSDYFKHLFQQPFLEQHAQSISLPEDSRVVQTLVNSCYVPFTLTSHKYAVADLCNLGIAANKYAFARVADHFMRYVRNPPEHGTDIGDFQHMCKIARLADDPPLKWLVVKRATTKKRLRDVMFDAVDAEFQRHEQEQERGQPPEDNRENEANDGKNEDDNDENESGGSGSDATEYSYRLFARLRSDEFDHTNKPREHPRRNNPFQEM